MIITVNLRFLFSISEKVNRFLNIVKNVKTLYDEVILDKYLILYRQC